MIQEASALMVNLPEARVAAARAEKVSLENILAVSD